LTVADKSSFSPEEWSVIREAPHLVALAISAAGASGMMGTLKEAVSGSSVIIEGTKSENALLRALCAKDEVKGASEAIRSQLKDLSGADLPAVKSKVKDLAITRVKAAVALLKAKGGPGDAATYRDLIEDVAQRVSEAAKEGGFLGFGGERVSKEEKQMLESLEAVLV
jgi:hypothetical protein